MLKIVFATHNPHKLYEVKAMLPASVELLGLHDLNFTEEVPETQPTLEGNALQKARYVHERLGCNCFADDTGLEVEALDGAPGVISARYAGDHKNSEDNIDKLLLQLEGKASRRARFRTVIALIIQGEEMLFEGIVEGEIIRERRGAEGFGYDPVFVPQGHSQTFAQMPLELKNTLSHRFRAVKMLAEYLMSVNYM